jgi:hypothetical protein
MGRPLWVSAFAFASNDLKHMMVIQMMGRKYISSHLIVESISLFDGFALFISDEFIPFAFSGNVFVQWRMTHFRRNLVPIMSLLL